MKLLSKLFGTKNDRELKRMSQIVAKVNGFEASMEALTDQQVAAQRSVFQDRLSAGETLEDLLPEAFALVREAGRRTLSQRIFDVQLIGGITLHEGRIAEMRTGEGKTLVATLPLYLNAIGGEGVCLVTANDYLAQRGAEWMGPVFESLGMSVGVVYAGQDQEEKIEAYQSDIAYGTNNEFGFDYLRDNMAFAKEDKVQKSLNFAIVDEVDSILIDEARTPLIISGGVENASAVYQTIDAIIPNLDRQLKTAEDEVNEIEPPGDFYVDEKQRDIELTEDGHLKVESLLVRNKLLDDGDSLYGTSNLTLLHHVHVGLKAHHLFREDVDYMVGDGEVLIVDEHTGRAMPGRRWSGGIHQAIEAKHRLNITHESQTLASTTFQNYFRLYDKLAGMTGTADTEAFEFQQIYGLDVVVIPTNVPSQRDDMNDLIFMSVDEKFESIVEEIVACRERHAPVLVGTASIESSERLAGLLTRDKIHHEVLNAKNHQREAEIIAEAGRPGAVTIATNMAGRGTDIILGGNWESEVASLGEDATDEATAAIRYDWQKRHEQVLKAGGLHVLGTERHESRRIDNQLRGRSGRQGDAGSSRFYLSLEDDLMRIFTSDRVKGFMQNLGLERGEAIEHKMVNNAIEKAQKKVEARNFDIRKNLLEYDDVANDQRQMVYQRRNELMETDDISDTIEVLWEDVGSQIIDTYLPPQSLEEQWDVPGLEQAFQTEFGLQLPIRQWLDEDDDLHEESLRARVISELKAEYAAKDVPEGLDMRLIEKQIMLQVLDNLWKEHLAGMDNLRQGIHLRAYGQKQPKQEYKRESFELFQGLLENIKLEVIRFLSRVQFQSPEDGEAMERQRREEAARSARSQQMLGAGAQDMGAPAGAGAPVADGATPFVRRERKVGRNEPCPCGSGKKYKACHGKLG
jgi:preprotein translocase subunit SecA